MWYVFQNDICVASCSREPNSADLASRGQIAVKSELGVPIPIEEAALDNGKVVWQKPILSLDELKNWKLREINLCREKALNCPVIFDGQEFDTSNDSLTRMSVAAVSARNALTEGKDWEIDWVNGDKSTAIDAKRFLTLFDNITLRNTRIFKISRQLKERVRNAFTKEQIESVQWPENIYSEE